MPLSRCRTSVLGPLSTERTASSSCTRTGAGGTAALRCVFAGTIPTLGGASSLGTRVSRRALGISSVFLQGMRSSTAPVLSPGVRHSTPAASLNSCLIEYCDKVQALEQLNQQLEERIRLCLERRASSTGTWGSLRTQWEDVYRQVSEAILDNARLMLLTENVQANAEDFKDRYENEQPFRNAVEEEISSLYKVIDDANMTKAELEEQTDKMRAELRNLELHYEQDVQVLYSQIAGREVDETDKPTETSLDQILTYIRKHWEKVTEKNQAETDNYKDCKQCESSRLRPKEEEVDTLIAECHNTGCRIQSLQAETESIRALKRGLENSLGDARYWHEVELQNLGSVVTKLEAELSDVRGEMEQHHRDYDALLTSKQQLEQEISLYHNILDGEETRFRPTEPTCPDQPSQSEGAAGSPEPESRTNPVGPTDQ
ncbi:phakinin [Thalassophryne amazonica]|uniref:phakinin n=1 Tax=Thalassophryne amazonica TaxID=390379 RepID=UPI0014720BBC|nr:phakinin [Thalassophryne amazonica]